MALLTSPLMFVAAVARVFRRGDFLYHWQANPASKEASYKFSAAGRAISTASFRMSTAPHRVAPVMKRILLLVSLTSATVSLHGLGQRRVHAQSGRQQPFNVVEATIPEMQAAMKQGRVTSRDLVVQYLIRIALYNSKLNAIITVNPHALREAVARDRERAQGKVRGPLHGIPIALKDNMQTTDMPTTGGALAFDGFVPPYEATLTKNLRDAGAIIIAKTGMTELANWVASGMPG